MSGLVPSEGFDCDGSTDVRTTFGINLGIVVVRLAERLIEVIVIGDVLKADVSALAVWINTYYCCTINKIYWQFRTLKDVLPIRILVQDFRNSSLELEIVGVVFTCS